jgi:signal transduction histidine kinase
LEVDAPVAAVWIEGDHVRLSQVVLNLLTNAAKYTDHGGRIRVELRREPDALGKMRALIRVCDSGIGIDAAHLPKIFQPFTQVSHPGERLGAGLGLGLAICKRLVELHGGRISAHSAGRLQGSEFLVELPERGATPS